MQQRLSDGPATDGRLHVLLVEHNEKDARLLLNLMAGAGEEVNLVWAASFIDALTEMRKQTFDAMLLDLSLPDSEGIESIRRISDRADIPIIALTKESDDRCRIEPLLAGAEDTFIKERINSSNVIRAVQYAIARHRRIGELHALSLIDELTGLYNRRAFMTLGDHQLKIARRQNSSVTLAFADLDGLKSINDQCGHMWGDFALKDIANILKNTFRNRTSSPVSAATSTRCSGSRMRRLLPTHCIPDLRQVLTLTRFPSRDRIGFR
jgi:PleD family two-component response regulator